MASSDFSQSLCSLIFKDLRAVNVADDHRWFIELLAVNYQGSLSAYVIRYRIFCIKSEKTLKGFSIARGTSLFTRACLQLCVRATVNETLLQYFKDLINRAHSFPRQNLTNSAANLVNSAAYRGKADEILRLTAATQLNFRGLIKS